MATTEQDAQEQTAQEAPQGGGPLSPFRKMLATNQKKLANLLPDYMAPERYLSLAMLAIYRSPELQRACIEAPHTVVDAILRAAQLGFEIGGPVPAAHLVPFFGKVPGTDRKAMQAVMIPDYRGLINLAVESGAILSADARIVYDGEPFKVQYGTEPKIVHEPDFGAIDAGNIVAAYFVARLPNGATQFEIMTHKEVMKIKARSKASGNGPWVTDFGEMAKKTVTKRGLKYVPMNPNNRESRRLALAIEADNRYETGESGVVVPEWGENEEAASAQAADATRNRLDDLRERMGGRDVTEQSATQEPPADANGEPWPEPEPAAEEEQSRPRRPRAAAAAPPAREPGSDDDMPV